MLTQVNLFEACLDSSKIPYFQSEYCNKYCLIAFDSQGMTKFITESGLSILNKNYNIVSVIGS